MASVMKLTSSAAGKLVMRQGVLQAFRGAASQVKRFLCISSYLIEIQIMISFNIVRN